MIEIMFMSKLPSSPDLDSQDLLAGLGFREAARRELASGEVLFCTGERPKAFYWVESGAVHLIRHDRNGTPLVIHVARTGDWLAEASLFASAYHCDAVAEKPSRLRVLPLAEVKEILASRPDLALSFAATLARHLQRARARLEIAALKSAEARILAYFDLLADGRGRIGFDRPLRLVAWEIALTPEAFYRSLASLEKSGRLKRLARREWLIIAPK
jgi:CRP-like cAMP-binding protein